ncbi:MAG: UvrD-helicase domain-containing protein [Pseudomonadota bacterium]
MDLNSSQREAVRYTQGPLLVLAGAGSGKTRVITAKIAHLISTGTPAYRIAAITFTNKAAREMQERIRKVAPPAAANAAWICTFHALGLKFLREEHRELGYKSTFSILGPTDTANILIEISGQADRGVIYEYQNTISQWKNALVHPDDAHNHIKNPEQAVTAKLYQRYQETLRAYQAFDFDDLIIQPVILLQSKPEVADRWKNRFLHILVDEYQDTNPAQYALLKYLAGPNPQFTAVGDDDQAIYAWRGASLDNLAKLPEEFPSLKVIKLEQNYRSTIRILNAANHLIQNNPKLFPKTLWSDLGLGDKLKIMTADTEETEAELVVMRLQAHKFENQTKLKDYAILYRSNHQARILEQHLRQQGIPYEMSGGQSFFDRSEIKDILAYLRLLVNPDDDPAFIRAVTTPKRGIGSATLEQLGKLAHRYHCSLFDAVFHPQIHQELNEVMVHGLNTFAQFISRLSEQAQKEPAAIILDTLLNAIQYERWLYDHDDPKQAERRWKVVQEFVHWCRKREEGTKLAEMVQTITLINLLEGQEDERDVVRLSTLHAAKGLEFPHVFLIGVEEGILPHRESVDSGQVEEERRLMYVGITRAQRSLTISYCTKRKKGKEHVSVEPSRFLSELPPDEVDWPQSLASQNKSVEERRAEGTAKLANLKAMLLSQPT